jgi:hypothetical protein
VDFGVLWIEQAMITPRVSQSEKPSHQQGAAFLIVVG